MRAPPLDFSTSAIEKSKHMRRNPVYDDSYEEIESHTSRSPAFQEDSYIGTHSEFIEEDDEQSLDTTSNQRNESQSVTRTREGDVAEDSVNSTGPPNLSTQYSNSTYINIAPLPIFRGSYNECPVAHLSRFARVCRANNGSTVETMMRIFPVTLDDEAALWYELNVEPFPSMNWEEIKDKFVKTYRRVEFLTQFRSELMRKKDDTESVNAFYLRMQWILKKWPEHGISDSILRGIFIDGLREDYQDWIIPQNPVSLDEALKLALTWERLQTLRANRHRNHISTTSDNSIKCGFCEEEHEESSCEIRRKMKELWLKSRDRALMSSPKPTDESKEEDVPSLSPALSFIRRQVEADDKNDNSRRKSQCQCWKHQCWKKNQKSDSLFAGSQPSY